MHPPPGYRIHSTTDLRDDRGVAVSIQAIAVLIVAAMVGLAVLLDLPFGSTHGAAATAAVTIAACAAYMVVHELTHGLFVRLVSGRRPTYSVRFPYLTTGSEATSSRS